MSPDSAVPRDRGADAGVTPDTGDAFRSLSADLKAAFEGWRSEDRWDGGIFRDFARRCFRLQYRRIETYRRYCDRRGRTPRTVTDWRDVPPVPTAAFRAAPLVVGDDPSAAEEEFLTSGTSRGDGGRGRHLVRDPELYRASLAPPFERFVLSARASDGAATSGVRILSLLPPAREAPGSSLCWMGDALIDRYGEAASASVARGPEALARPGSEPGDALDWEEARDRAEAARRQGEPLLVLATTLAAAEWTGRLAEEGVRMELPDGSRLMDTGGAKGREGLDRRDVLASVEERLGISPRDVVNEFGMTELLSQRYAPSAGEGAGWLRGPPWLRTRALDPETLEEVPEGEVGILCHHDLANAGSVSVVLTEDRGRVRDGRVEHLGRAASSPPRGCSLATADLLEIREETRP